MKRNMIKWEEQGDRIRNNDTRADLMANECQALYNDFMQTANTAGMNDAILTLISRSYNLGIASGAVWQKRQQQGAAV